MGYWIHVPFPTDLFPFLKGPSTKGRIFTHCYNARTKKDRTKNSGRMKARQNSVAPNFRSFPIRTWMFDLPQTRRPVIWRRTYCRCFWTKFDRKNDSIMTGKSVQNLIIIFTLFFGYWPREGEKDVKTSVIISKAWIRILGSLTRIIVRGWGAYCGLLNQLAQNSPEYGTQLKPNPKKPRDKIH